ncbi:RNA-directed DNA polymerase, eukaryota, reverse transcriptase zinc-binding domain protein, partial [Tanacetum coccineum]
TSVSRAKKNYHEKAMAESIDRRDGWWVLIPETTFVGVESRVLIPEMTFVSVESRVLIPETTFVGVKSRVLIPETTVWDTLVYPSDTLVIPCLSSSRASILVNGSPTSEFSINRGLRQGDLLSLFLFILVMEGLHNAFAEAVGNGLISGININNSTINISHIFFADDVIITIDWNARDLKNSIRVLHVFYLASGLKINIHKSNIYGIGVNEQEVSNMASNAGCIASNILFNYLGLPIGSNMKSIASWKMLVDRFHLRISTWKANLLSIGGRLTLSNGKKMAWVKWPIILNSFDKGGLNIGSLKAFNLAFLQKWRWRMFSFPNDLWVKVVKAIHGHEGGFDNTGCSFKGTWANIVVELVYVFGKIFRSARLLFLPGTIAFTTLIKIKIVSSLTVSIMGNGIGIGTFTVKDARNIIDQKTLPSLAPSTTWDKTIPRKVNIFMWILSLDRLPHRLNLSLRGMDIPAISCSSCNANVESANHIFFECIIATEMWKLVYRWCEIPFVQASSLEAFKDWFISWHVISTSVLWWLLRYRNSVTFNSEPLRKSGIFDYVRSSSFFWLHNRGKLILSWTDWLKSTLLTACLDNG